MFEMDVPLIFAFSAGLVAAFNPCGAAMFPAYVGYQLDSVQVSGNHIMSVIWAIVLGLSATSGFVVVFGSVGIILALGGKVVDKFLPFVGLGIGVIITSLGLFLLISRHKVGIMAASRVNLGQGKGVRSVFLFGIAYALASLSCALPVFLSAVGIVSGQSLSTSSVAGTVVVSVTYGIGMGSVLVAATLGVVFFKRVVEEGIRLARSYVEPIGNVAMVGAGMYLIYYWVFGKGSDLLVQRTEQIFG